MPSDEKGGKLTFIGGELMRHPEEKAEVVSVNPQYLEPAFKDFGIEKRTQAVLDVAFLLEDGSPPPLRTSEHCKLFHVKSRSALFTVQA